jgi:hypothetical protein
LIAAQTREDRRQNSNGEYEKAIESIVKQAERGWFWLFLHRTEPFLDPIRDDPRFKEAIKKLDPPQ